MSAHRLREDYADAMMLVQDACRADGASFFAEMTWLMAAWLTTRHAQGRPTAMPTDLPEPDEGEISPARQLLRLAEADPRSRTAPPPPPPPPPQAGPVVEGTVPDPVIVRGPPPRLHASSALPGVVLYELLKHGGEGIKTPANMAPATLRTRLSAFSSRSPTHRLKLTEQPDGSHRIIRVARTGRRARR